MIHRFIFPALCLSLSFALAGCNKPSAQDIKYSEGKAALAIELINQGETVKALGFLKKALKRNPENVDAYVGLGICYTKIGKLTKAVSNLRKALEIDPENSTAHTNLGIAYSGLGRYDEAIMEFKEALRNELYRSPDVAYFNMGVTYMVNTREKDHLVKAENYLRKSVDLNRLNCPGYGKLAELFEKREKPKLAEENYLAALDFCPEFTAVRLKYAGFLMRSHRTDEACVNFDRVRAESDDPKLKRQASNTYESLGCEPIMTRIKGKEKVEEQKRQAKERESQPIPYPAP